jgi:hypothetical protein
MEAFALLLALLRILDVGSCLSRSYRKSMPQDGMLARYVHIDRSVDFQCKANTTVPG